MLDFEKIRTYAIRERQNKFSLDNMIPLENDRQCDDPGLKPVAEAIIEAKRRQKKVIIMLGGAVVKVGCSGILVDMMKRGLIDHIAVNGAVSIHDFEVGLIGETSEDVERGLEDGMFGMVEETGRFLNEAIREGYRKKKGYGESVGRKIAEMQLPHRDFSLFYHAVRLEIPITVHVAVGGDIIHQHPACDGAALGATSYTDFRILADSVAVLSGGVLLNIGSAVNLPEAFLKALTIVRNLEYDVRAFTVANFDFIDMYRPRTRLLEWPRKLGCDTHDIRANHADSIPTLYRLLLS